MNKDFNNNSHRLLRVNELIKRELSSLLQGMEWEEQGIKNLNLTLTDVECSKDIRIAKIYYIPTGMKNSESIEKAVNSRKKEIRKYLGKKIHLMLLKKLLNYLKNYQKAKEKYKSYCYGSKFSIA